MNINPNTTCLVLDLDDTLYKEYDYQTSGLQYVERKISDLYDINLDNYLINLRDKGESDIFMKLIDLLGLSQSTKDSLIYLYRNHNPKIKLSDETRAFMKSIKSNFNQIVILTDGRSYSQRLKLKALGLINIPVYISEEWESKKPEKKRYIEIMEKYKQCKFFCYVGDNPAIDFVTPNSLGWITFGIKGNNQNIHSQNVNSFKNEFLPNHWLNNLNELFSFVKY